MSPTIFRERGYRFFFFSREESRMHVHVYCGDGEAKYWLEPEIELARNCLSDLGLTDKDCASVQSKFACSVAKAVNDRYAWANLHSSE